MRADIKGEGSQGGRKGGNADVLVLCCLGGGGEGLGSELTAVLKPDPGSSGISLCEHNERPPDDPSE